EDTLRALFEYGGPQDICLQFQTARPPIEGNTYDHAMANRPSAICRYALPRAWDWAAGSWLGLRRTTIAAERTARAYGFVYGANWLKNRMAVCQPQFCCSFCPSTAR